MRPRAFWQAVVKIWAPQTAATDASLLVKASEFDELVNGARGRQGAAVVRRRLEKVLQASRARSTSQTGAGEPGKSAGVSSGASGGGTDPDRYLSKKQVQALWDAGSFLIQQHGRLLNTRLSLRYAALGITDPRAVGPFLSRLTHEMRMLVKERTKRTRPEAFHWLYVHEHNDRQGMSTLLVAHLPEGAGDVTGWLRDDFLPRRVKVSFPEEAFTLRRARVPEERRFAHHLHLLLVLCRGIHPNLEVCFHDAEARMHRSYRRLRGPIGNRRGPQRYGVSELIGRGARDLVSELDLPVLSAFGKKQWGHLASGWEWEEHRYRQAIADERRALEDEVRRNWPGDEAKLEAFRRRWARGVATRAQCRPGFSKPGAPESADGGG